MITKENLAALANNRKFRVIYADPPWEFVNKVQRNYSRSAPAEYHYGTMSWEEIAELPIEQICMKDSALFLWATNINLPFAFGVLERWGFKYKNILTWCKREAKQGMGYYFKNATEHCLVGFKGKPTVITEPYRGVPTYFVHERGKHSQKPGIIYRIIESYFFPPYIELFGRVCRKNWTVLGSQLIKYFEF